MPEHVERELALGIAESTALLGGEIERNDESGADVGEDGFEGEAGTFADFARTRAMGCFMSALTRSAAFPAVSLSRGAEI